MFNRSRAAWEWIFIILVIVVTIALLIGLGLATYLAATATSDNAVLLYTQVALAILQGASLLFLIVYVIKTWEMASAARQSAEIAEKTVSEMREARDQETAPHVIVYFDIPMGTKFIYFVVKNIGKSPAKAVKMEFYPPIQSTDNLFEKFSPLKNGIGSLAPDQEIRTFFDLSFSYLNSGLPLEYVVKVSYYGGLSKNQREDLQVLDLSMYHGRAWLGLKGLEDLYNQIDNLNRSQDRIVEALEKLSTVVEDGLKQNTAKKRKSMSRRTSW